MIPQYEMNSNKYVCIHGHFYQPPRENAWLDIIELQESAAPFHDWNVRINFECYAPNAAARILGKGNTIRKIANNYANISFNFGPTLLSWIEKADPSTYQQILESDKISQQIFNGHGGALAQAYNHMIMPLATAKDKETQVKWGIADFEYRFGKKPEGMWLPETAVDTETLEVLAGNGILFTVLAPRQAKAIRKAGEEAWTEVHENINTRRAYQCQLPSGKSMALFFYDGVISKDVAFNGLLNDGAALASRLYTSFSDDDRVELVHIATDGESYGHHHRFGEMALASCIDFIKEKSTAQLTVYGEFLEKFPPEYEVIIHENSSWSCVHGVERWRSDCGCSTSSQAGWNQAWRAPLREALDWLQKELLPIFENETSKLVEDIWKARNDYITVILNRSKENTNRFFYSNCKKELTQDEKTKLLRLMEMQRYSMLMYTSCAWFFAEISGIETDQVLQYALRAMNYAEDLTGISLYGKFEKRLEEISSNVYPNGAESYRLHVVPAELNLLKMAMHYAATTVFEDETDHAWFLHYKVSNEVFERVPAGFQTLAMGRTKLTSRITYSEKNFSFFVLHFGQQNLIGNVAADMSREEFDKAQEHITEVFRSSNLGDAIALVYDFGANRFSFKNLFKDEKRKILSIIMEKNLPPVETVIKDYYEDNYQLMTGVLQSKIAIPEGWRSITQFVVNRELSLFFANGKLSVRKLKNLVSEFERWNVHLTDKPALSLAAGERIFIELEKVEKEEAGLEKLQAIIDILEALLKLNVRPELWKSQNLFYQITGGYRRGEWVYASEAWKSAFMRLGELLNMEIE